MTAPTQQQTDEQDQKPTTEEQGTETGAQGAEPGADALGDKGKQALDRMKAERNGFRDELNQYKGLGLTPEQLQQLIAKSEEDAKTAEQARVQREAEQAAVSKANQRLVRAEVKAAATGKLANPQLALRLLDLSSFDVDDDGEVDSDAISAAIDELISKEPYLAQGDHKRFQGSGDVGPKGEPGKPQLTEEDVKRLSREGKHAEIEQARLDGRLNKILGIST